MANPPIWIDYTNWRRERSKRQIIPIGVIFGKNEWHPEEQYLLEAIDVEKGEMRTFALLNIHSFG